MSLLTLYIISCMLTFARVLVFDCKNEFQNCIYWLRYKFISRKVTFQLWVISYTSSVGVQCYKSSHYQVAFKATNLLCEEWLFTVIFNPWSSTFVGLQLVIPDPQGYVRKKKLISANFGKWSIPGATCICKSPSKFLQLVTFAAHFPHHFHNL